MRHYPKRGYKPSIELLEPRSLFAVGVPSDGTINSVIALNSIGGSSFGEAIAAIGDLDRDGVTDLAVGASRDGGLGRGAVYTLLMNANGTVKSFQAISRLIGGGPLLAVSDAFGASVAPLGDLDGDGVPEIAVGAKHDDTGGSDRGAVYILFLKSDGTAKSFQKIASSLAGGPPISDGGTFGSSLAAIGDLDGDGIADVAVGADRESGLGGPNRDAVYVLFLKADGTVKGSQKIGSATGGGPTLGEFDRFGCSIASLGDLNGDGLPDLAVGAVGDYTSGGSGLHGGAVYVLFLNADGTAKGSQKIASDIGGGPTLANFDAFGTSVAGIGDLDNDGIPDLAIGAIGDDTGGAQCGAVYILYLDATGTCQTVKKIANGESGTPVLPENGQFGLAVASTGDLNGDGVWDLVVGASLFEDSFGSHFGNAYLLFMNSRYRWHNGLLPPDVDQSLGVDIQDALKIITDLRNNRGSHILVGTPSIGSDYLDVVADGRADIQDVLGVIAYLRSHRPIAEGEGDASVEYSACDLAIADFDFVKRKSRARS